MAPTRRQTNSPTTAEYRRTPPRRPTTEWYHDKNLTVSEYARKAVADRPPRVKFTSQEIEHYAKLYVKYILLAQAQNEAMAHDPKRLQESYLRVESRLARERQGMKPITEVTYAQIDAALEDFEEECKKAPETFDDRILLATHAMNYITTMVDHVLNHPTRHHTDHLRVLRMASDELAKIARDPPHWAALGVAPKPPPAQTIELIPARLRERIFPVTQGDLEHWRDHPQDLVGIGFIRKFSSNPSEVAKDSVFFVRDSISTARGARHFEIQFEDSGEDVFPFGQDQLLELITTAKWVRVEAAPRS